MTKHYKVVEATCDICAHSLRDQCWIGLPKVFLWHWFDKLPHKESDAFDVCQPCYLELRRMRKETIRTDEDKHE